MRLFFFIRDLIDKAQQNPHDEFETRFDLTEIELRIKNQKI